MASSHKLNASGPVSVIARIGNLPAITLTPGASKDLNLASGEKYRITWGASGQAKRTYTLSVTDVSGDQPVPKWAGGGITLKNGGDAGTDEFTA